ncbi:MAG: phage baseplate assembly protein [Firmicutes bacterium]|nr:phage baseplate assembly protein [Bacillota bacterium]
MENIKNLLRVGTVSSVAYDTGCVRVCFKDQDSIVTDDLPMLGFEYEMPNVGELVLCIFLGNGLAKGFCLGRYYYDSSLPGESGENIYYKEFLQDAYMKYDKSSKTFTISAENIVFDGNVTINGTLTVSGDATISGKSFLSHTHSGVESGGSNTGAVV